MHQRREFGDQAEEIASNYLKTKGYQIIERNYWKPWGELDIIAKKDDVMVFVEVKANAKDFGEGFNPEVRADQVKMNKVIRTATLYLGNRLGGLDGEWRVDVISVTMDTDKAKLTHFKNVAEALF